MNLIDKVDIVLLKGFKNYFNRRVERYDTWGEYTDMAREYQVFQNINFKASDGINAEIPLNTSLHDADYLLVCKADSHMDIIARYFVMDVNFIRGNQATFRLKRDSIADKLDDLLDEPLFVEKGMLPDDDPMICNPEGMSFNQIKKEEILLKDKSQTAWLVGYIPKNIASFSVSYTDNPPASFVTEAQLASKTGISQSVISNLLTQTGEVRAFTSTASLRYICKLSFTASTGSSYRVRGYISSSMTSCTGSESMTALYLDPWPSLYNIDSNNYDPLAPVAKTFTERVVSPSTSSSTFLSELQSAKQPDGLLNSIQLNALKAMSGKLIFRNNAYYTITVTTGDYHDLSNKTIDGTSVPRVALALNSMLSDNIVIDIDSSAGIEVDGQTCRVTVTLTPYTITGTYSATLTGGEGNNTPGRPYRIFAMPYDDIRVVVNLVGVNSKGSICRGIAGKLQMGTSDSNPAYLYDLQLLPYCPFPNNIETDSDGPFVLFPTGTPATEYTFIKDGDNNNVGVIFYIDDDSFSTFIDTQLTLDESMKIDSQCDMWRICSPNYQGSFEFNVAKNGGSVSGFTAYCTYKPYTPFIRVAPDFHFLYGSEFGDMRGLICGGDFSLPSADNAWNTYQLNNKNYQNIFNRDIQSMDFNMNIQMRNQIVSSTVGILQDASKGAQAGAMAGGGWGALAGALIGGTTSAIGAGLDTVTLSQQQQEQRDYAIDKFNYQLGNIKALPYTITKVGSWDISSKIWPFLEHYQCSEQEKQALKDKITWESMTVMRIGTMREFKKEGKWQYIKGSFIRLSPDILEEDYHMLEDINNELMKGVYI